jgi:heptosyltransferase-2
MDTRILVIGPAWVGDMVMADVLFQILKSQKNCVIDVLAPEWSRPLTERMPSIRASLSMPLGHGEWQWSQRQKIAKTLKDQYDKAYVLPNSWKSALIPFLAHVPKRIGWLGEMRFGLLNDWRILSKKNYPRMIDRFAALAYAPKAPLPTLPMPTLAINPQAVKAAVAQYGLETERPILALCPGAEFGPSKQWPAAYYAEVANHALQQDWQVWLFGSAKDNRAAHTIQTLTRQQCQDLTGKTTLADAVDLMSLASSVITNDSGLMHIAAALQKPLIALYGSSHPGFTPPLSQHAQILRNPIKCSPCFQRTCPLGHHQCMQGLLPKTVIAAFQSEVVA